MKKEAVKFVAAIVLCAFFSAGSQASDYYWMDPGVAGDYSWKTIHNWGNSSYVVLGTVPTNIADAAFIYKSKECIIGTDMVGAAKAVAGNVYVGGGIANTNAFLTIKGEASFTNFRSGYSTAANSTGMVRIDPGAVINVTTFVVGNTGTAAYTTIGDCNMMGGTINVATTPVIGNAAYANGVMAMNGGTLNYTGAGNAFYIGGSAATAKGKLIVNNGAVVNNASNMYVGRGGSGEMIINSGGKVKTTGSGTFQAGSLAGATGSLAMNGGTLETASHLYIGTLTANNNFIQLNNDANVTVGGQLLIAPGQDTPTVISNAVGRLTIAGSTAKMKVASIINLGDATVGTGSATIELQGGTLTGLSTLVINSGSALNKINITGGTLILPIEQLSAVNGYIASGRIYTGYGSSRCIKVGTTATQVIVTADLSLLKMADNPIPADGNAFSAWSTADILLQWSPGDGAVSHDVYIGANYNDVNNADNTDTTGVYQGNQSMNQFVFNPSDLNLGKTIYWRVDEFDDAAVWKGSVWKLVPAFFTPASSYAIDSKIVSTSVFIWYSSTSGQLTGPWLPLDGRPNWTGEPDWWKSQIKQMMRANINVLYVHLFYESSWYDQKRINLFQALSELRREGYDVPKVVPFLDPIIAWNGTTRPYPDLATTAGKDEFVSHYIRFFNEYYSMNQDEYADDYIAKINGRVVLDTWHVFDINNVSSLTRQDVVSRLSAAFGQSHPIFTNDIYMIGTIGCGLSFEDEQIYQFQINEYYAPYTYNSITTTQLKGGYWDQNIRAPGSWLARNGGSNYTSAWNSANNNANLRRVYIESWSEYDEGTGIYAVDVNNSPHLIDGRYYSPGSTNDTWSNTNNPFEYIDTTAAGARQFNGIPDYNSVILWNNIPVKMNAGKAYKAYVLVRNTGDLSWTAATNFKFGQKEISPGEVMFGPGRYLIDDNSNEINFYGGIFRGRPIIFELTLTAPSKGNYVTHWQTLREHVQWFGQELTVPITVYAGADLNQDNFVNFLDLEELASQWLQSGQSSGNLNADEIVNFKDFAIMAKDWLK
jgi:T5SS/PEP-CTERM-associated repeat protein